MLAEQRAELRWLKSSLEGACFCPLIIEGSLKELGSTHQRLKLDGTLLGYRYLIPSKTEESSSDNCVRSRTYYLSSNAA